MLENLFVTENGEVQNTITGNWLKGDVNNCGYRRVQFNKKRFFVHRLVATEFVPNPDNLPQVNHKDGDKLNNHFTNLEWCSPSQNQVHKCFVLGKTIGSKSVNAKLTEEEVLEMRSCSENGESGRSLSRRFNVSQTLVRHILSRNGWKHI